PGAALEAFEEALIAVGPAGARLAAGEVTFDACCALLGVVTEPQAAIGAIARADPLYAQKLAALFERGEACGFEVRAPQGAVQVAGRATGAVAWLRLSRASGAADAYAGSRLRALLDARRLPVWIAAADGAPLWANRAWLAEVGGGELDPSKNLDSGKSLDSGADALAREAAQAGAAREAVRWTSLAGARTALRFIAQPLESGGVGVWAEDVTEAEELRETLRRQIAAHDETLAHVAEAAAIFTPGRKLSYHNPAFAKLWGLESSWLSDGPTHGEILDRLRQKRRLPETVNYSQWKANELLAYESSAALPDELWTLPDRRTLRVVRQPHPMGGLLLLFSDISSELRLKAQYNALIQVQQATLDRLNDAVAVFGSDGRLRLHNEAFLRFWTISPSDFAAAGDFEGVVDLCVPKLHDMGFWSDIKGRLADTDPQARTPTSGEVKLSDDRIAAYQSRPLPDGATLIAFADVTGARRLEVAVQEREAALKETEELKRDFVGNVSYELRTPLTTIIGYSELLERAGQTMSERARGHVAAVRQAAVQLAHSIDDVLDMAAIDAGELALDVEDVGVGALVEAGLERAARMAAEAQVEVELQVEEPTGLLRGDSRRLGQVLDHLLENALRQTPPGGKVIISARKGNGVVKLQVADTGRGIPFHVQAKIFDRFVRREHGGPGLGLALVKELVELHGGWVTLQSEPGAGATFTCHLPEASAQSGQRELGL
ncbi:MAG: two-component sensor histidine kinase, partial [Caulobacteraceae bacterium]|nr:two-component sensor histidine kinase [Caulobacteraceae bacterium]